MQEGVKAGDPGNGGRDGKIRRRKFTTTEDKQLKTLYEQFGDSNWERIAASMDNRTPRQCKERYKKYLAPGLNLDKWSKEEEALLLEKLRDVGKKWAVIAAYFPNRTDVNIKNHWNTMKTKIAKSGYHPMYYPYPYVQPNPYYSYANNQYMVAQDAAIRYHEAIQPMAQGNCTPEQRSL